MEFILNSILVIKEEFVFPVCIFNSTLFQLLRHETLDSGSRVSRVILIFASPGGGAGHGVPIYFRILQHFDIITSSFLGISLAKSELNSNCLHRDQRRNGLEWSGVGYASPLNQM